MARWHGAIFEGDVSFSEDRLPSSVAAAADQICVLPDYASFSGIDHEFRQWIKTTPRNAATLARDTHQQAA